MTCILLPRVVCGLCGTVCNISRDWSRSRIKSCNPKNQIWGLSRNSGIRRAQPWRGCLHPQPRPKPFLAHWRCNARRHFWLGLVASARCQPHGLDRCSPWAAATESSSELSVERAGAANEAFSIANSFRLAAPEGKGKRSRPGDLDLRGTHTLAYGREHVFGARTVTCETSLACVSDRTKVCIGVKLRAASGP